ncbi:hypothetical protein NMG60_11016470 [Bertholletia excelsa]
MKTMSSAFTQFALKIILACLAMTSHNYTVAVEFRIDGDDNGGCYYGRCSPPFTPPSTTAAPPIPPSPIVSLPPPAQGQKPLAFADRRLGVVYPVIQTFKATITSDPLGITRTWVGPDICSYTGFYCDNPPDNRTAIAIASVDFNGFRLGAPTLAGFLDRLPDIALFHANTNNFAGAVPDGVAKLPYLYELDLSNNQLSGPFPTAVLGMTDLSFLDLRFNQFTGSVPAQLFTQNLDVIFLNNNNFITFPDNLGSSHVLFLTLANNRFTGPIPRSIFKSFLTLSEVLFLNNMLTGCLPYEVGLLKEVVVFDFSNNRLTGPVPMSLGCLEMVQVLNLAGNLLYGMVPEVVCALENLVNLSLADNYFTQVGPICRALMTRGGLDIRNNCVPGLPFQRPIRECVDFFAYPRGCPHSWAFAYIPCWVSHFGSPPLDLPSPPS